VDGQTLDPALQLVRALRRRLHHYGFCEPTVTAARARLRREIATFTGPPTRVGAVRDVTIAGAAGALRARHYAPPSAGAPRPLLVYLHGGGFVVCDLDTHDEPCRLLCRHGDVHVLSVDYRLAPEHPFPAAIDDTLAALRWARAHAASLGADPSRVALGGDSAGGTLATVVSRITAREGDPPAAQLLVYPATDSVTPRPSHVLFREGFFLDQRDRDDFARNYMRGAAVHGSDPRLSPLLAPDLGGLPPALVVVAGFDILRDEGDAYAAALAAAGNVVHTLRLPSLGHSFVNMTGICPSAHRAMVKTARHFAALLDAPPERDA
jgi:acetyl esterase